MGGDFEVDPAAPRAAAGELRGTLSDVDSHGAALGAATEAPVGEGALGRVVEDAAKRGIAIVERGITDAVRAFHEATAAGPASGRGEATERTLAVLDALGLPNVSDEVRRARDIRARARPS